MAIWQPQQATCDLTSALSSASVSATVDDCSAWNGLTSDYTTWTVPVLSQIFDGGVTQANPEYILVQYTLGSTSLSIRRRGVFNTSIPASWPIGSTISAVNNSEVINAASAFYNGYPILVKGWTSSAASNPLNNRCMFHGGTGTPSNATDFAIADLIDDHWDIGNLINQMAAGDLVRLKYIWIDDDLGQSTAAAATINYHPTARIEFKIDTGGVTDNTGWWTIPIDSAYFHIHSNLDATSDGIAGLAMLDFMKLV